MDTPDFKVRLEYTKHYVILHLPEVKRKVTPGLIRQGLVTISDLNKFFKTVGYLDVFVAVYKTDNATKKLARRLGFLAEGTFEEFVVYKYKEK